jgi:hypothetical protein
MKQVFLAKFAPLVALALVAPLGFAAAQGQGGQPGGTPKENPKPAGHDDKAKTEADPKKDAEQRDQDLKKLDAEKQRELDAAKQEAEKAGKPEMFEAKKKEIDARFAKRHAEIEAAFAEKHPDHKMPPGLAKHDEELRKLEEDKQRELDIAKKEAEKAGKPEMFEAKKKEIEARYAKRRAEIESKKEAGDGPDAKGKGGEKGKDHPKEKGGEKGKGPGGG